LKEHALFGDSHASPACPSVKSNKKMWNMVGIMLAKESRIIGGEPVPASLYPPQIHMDWPVIKAGLHGRTPTTNRLRRGKP